MGRRLIFVQDDHDEIILDSFVDLLSCGLGGAILLFLIFVTLPRGADGGATPIAEQFLYGAESGSAHRRGVTIVALPGPGGRVLSLEDANASGQNDIAVIDGGGFRLNFAAQEGCAELKGDAPVEVTIVLGNTLAKLGKTATTEVAISVSSSGIAQMTPGKCQ